MNDDYCEVRLKSQVVFGCVICGESVFRKRLWISDTDSLRHEGHEGEFEGRQQALAGLGGSGHR